MEESVSIRPYQENDFDRLATWVSDKKEFAYWGGAWFDFPLEKGPFNQHHSETDHTGFSAIDSLGNLLGYFEIRELHPKEGRLFRVIVKPDARSKGIGRRILAEALRVGFEEMDFVKVGLGVFDTNHPAIRCYKAAGFTSKTKRQSHSRLLQEEILILNMEIRREDWENSHPHG